MFDEAWRAMGGPPPASFAWTGPEGILPARLPVADLARACVAACALAAASLAAARGAAVPEPLVLSNAAVATAFTSERHLRLDGAPTTPFAPLSRFWPTADGHVRTHANYPHHRARLLAAVGCAPDAVGDTLRTLPSAEVEARVTAAGGLAVTVRRPPARIDPVWPIGLRHEAAGAFSASDPGRDIPDTGEPGTAGPGTAGSGDGWSNDAGSGWWAASLPLAGALPAELLRITRTPVDGRPFRPAPAGRPAAGVRVLDLTRVIAGPVATRTLAFLGADVLRIDPPGLPEIPEQHLDVGFGKRSTLLDLADGGDRAVFDELLDTADVIVTGYRPGALDRLGVTPEALRERRPDLIVARLSAWGEGGGRGFDSLVQAATGIAVVEGDGAPGALPAQALDHGTGYLLAAAVLLALVDRGRGVAHTVDAALAATARWLLDAPPAPRPAEPIEPTVGTAGGLTYALPAFTLPGGPRTWPSPPTPWGRDRPQWRNR